MGLKIFIASITPNTEIKKRTQRIRMVLESMGIEFEAIDISLPGTDQERDFMKNNCKVVNGKAAAIPPQIFNDNEYCGGYDEFENAIELNQLHPFLKLEHSKNGTNGEPVDMGGFGEPAEDEDAAWARRMKAKRAEVQEEEEPTAAEPVLEEDEDAAWQRRLQQKRQQQQQEDEEQEPAAVEEEQVVLEEDEDAAWQRRLKQKRQQLDEEENEAVETKPAEEEPEAVLEEDEDAAWQRRLKQKKQVQQKDEEDEGEKEEKPEEPEPEVLVEDEDAAWQRRLQQKRQQQKMEESNKEEEKEEKEKEEGEEEEIIDDDDVEVEDEEGGSAVGVANSYMLEIPSSKASLWPHFEGDEEIVNREGRSFQLL